MQFDEPQVIQALREEWGWCVPEIREVIAVSAMGNVYLADGDGCYWRICPEELSAEIVARSPAELQTLFADPEEREDWQMSWVVSEMVELHGEPAIGECFGLVIPAAFGGGYVSENIRKRGLYDYLRFTGDVARQSQDLKDGDKVRFKFT